MITMIDWSGHLPKREHHPDHHVDRLDHGYHQFGHPEHLVHHHNLKQITPRNESDCHSSVGNKSRKKNISRLGPVLIVLFQGDCYSPGGNQSQLGPTTHT